MQTLHVAILAQAAASLLAAAAAERKASQRRKQMPTKKKKKRPPKKQNRPNDEPEEEVPEEEVQKEEEADFAGGSTGIPKQKADAVTAAAAPVFAPPGPRPPRVHGTAESKRLHVQRLKDIAYAKAEGYTLVQPLTQDSVALDQEAPPEEEEAEPPPEEEEAELPSPPTPSENGDFLDHAHDPPQAELTQQASKKKKVDDCHCLLVHKEKFIRLATQDLAMTAEDALSKWEDYEKAPAFPADRDQKGPPNSRLRLRLLSIPASQ